MSIETQYYSQAAPLFTVPKTEFSPMPDVNGLVVDFALHLPEDRAVDDAQGFLAMVSLTSKTLQGRRSCIPLRCEPHLTDVYTTHRAGRSHGAGTVTC